MKQHSKRVHALWDIMWATCLWYILPRRNMPGQEVQYNAPWWLFVASAKDSVVIGWYWAPYWILNKTVILHCYGVILQNYKLRTHRFLIKLWLAPWQLTHSEWQVHHITWQYSFLLCCLNTKLTKNSRGIDVTSRAQPTFRKLVMY